MAGEWFCKKLDSTNVLGPFSTEDIKRFAFEGKLTELDFLRKGTTGQWVSASKVKGLFEEVIQKGPEQSSRPSSLEQVPSAIRQFFTVKSDLKALRQLPSVLRDSFWEWSGVIFAIVICGVILVGMFATGKNIETRQRQEEAEASKAQSFTMKGTVQYCDSDGIVLQDAATGALVPLIFDAGYQGRRDIQPKTRVIITFRRFAPELELAPRILTLTEE